MLGDSTYCSIKDFKKLKVVELDWLTLVPYQQEIMNDADIDEPLSQGFYEEQSDEVAPSDFDFTNALPPTIKHLTVNKIPDPEALPSLRHLLAEKEKGRFPDLKKIALNPYFWGSKHYSEWDGLQKAVERTGVILENSTESEVATGGTTQDMDVNRDE